MRLIETLDYMKMKFILSLFALVIFVPNTHAQSNKYPALKVNFRTQIEQSDLIVVGKLKVLALEERVLGIQLYEILPEIVLKPNYKIEGLIEELGIEKKGNSVVSGSRICFYINNNLLQSIGNPPKLQSDSDYLFFLKLADNPPIWKGKIIFNLVNLWQGVVPLDQASENRILVGTLDSYGVDILNNKKAFVEAIRSYIDQSVAEGEVAEVKRKLNLESPEVSSKEE